MASKLLRRSGVAVGLIAELLDWRADSVYQVGVGYHHEEVDILIAEWPGVRFFGCEPHPGIVKGIQEKYPGELFQVAISDQVGCLPLHTKRTHADGASLYEIPEKTTVIRVPVETLDHLFPSPIGERILLWLDCEGSELQAIQGGWNFLQRVQVVNVEITTNPRPGWSRPIDVHRILVNRGFKRQWIHTQRACRSINQYDAIYVQPKLFRPEYCCDPE